MEYPISKTSGQTLGLGAIAGMRATVAPALLSHFLAKSPVRRLDGSFLRYLQYPKVAIGAKLLAAAELVADKLPNAPDRISPAQMLPRVLAGALVGARKTTGALLGGLAAVASSYAFFYLRKELGQSTGLPDAALAVVEDGLAIMSGVALLKE